MRPVTFRARAIAKINRQTSYFETEAPHVIEPFKSDLRETIALIRSFPHAGYDGEVKGTREILSVKFKYIIVYIVHKDTLEVLRIYFRGQERTPS